MSNDYVMSTYYIMSHENDYVMSNENYYRVTTISRLFKIIELFCRM